LTPDQYKRKLNNARLKARREATKYLRKRIPEYIILRTKSGEGIDREFSKLDESTISNRERYTRQLSRDTSPSESNITASGQLLKAIISEIIGNTLKFSINDKIRKKFPKPKNPRKNAINKPVTNREVQGYLEGRSDKYFKFFGLSDYDMKELSKETKDFILEILKRELNA
jgi:hypothetical protein